MEARLEVGAGANMSPGEDGDQLSGSQVGVAAGGGGEAGTGGETSLGFEVETELVVGGTMTGLDLRTELAIEGGSDLAERIVFSGVTKM